MMTFNDKKLIEEAYETPYWNWPDVMTAVEDADSPEAKKILKNIASLLWDYAQEGLT